MRSLVAACTLLLASTAAAGEDTDPFAAYAAGDFDHALRLFLEAQVERPKDPRLAFNIGNVHYRLGEYAAAAQAFARAAAAEDPTLRAQASYNLGNALFREQKLEEAAKAYEQTLAITPEDEAARHNLEVVRRSLEQQQQQQGSQGDQEDASDPPTGREQSNQAQGRDPPQAGDSQRPAAGPQDRPQPGRGRDPEQPSSPHPPEPSPGDADGDGLADDLERTGVNRTSPTNPDTDGDGLSDGEEDRNRNAAVDPGETDPTRADSDGDGVPDGLDEARRARGSSRGSAEGRDGLSREEAERYLHQLGDARLRPVRKQKGGRAKPPAKDW